MNCVVTDGTMATAKATVPPTKPFSQSAVAGVARRRHRWKLLTVINPGHIGAHSNPGPRKIQALRDIAERAAAVGRNPRVDCGRWRATWIVRKMARDRTLSIRRPRERTFIGAIAVMLVAMNALGIRSAFAAPPTDAAAQFREFVCRLIDGSAAANRLPASFLARILWQESRLRDTTSPAGAEGIAQFMPRTAVERGLADPRDPAPAIAAAARLLADLRLQFGNLGFAAAAYNAGSGRVMKWLRNQSDLPSETHLYVVAVTGRPVEEWRFSAGAPVISGRVGEPCLAVMPEFAHSAPGRPSSPSWALQLDRSLARAVGVISASPSRQRGPGLKSLRESLALCDRIRLLGGRCAVFEP